MPKSPENFDFSKPEDLKRFKRLVPKTKEKIFEQAQHEAGRMQKFIEWGMAANYDEAAEVVSLEHQVNDLVNSETESLQQRLEKVETAAFENGKKKLKFRSYTVTPRYERGRFPYQVEDYLDEKTGEAYSESQLRSRAYKNNPRNEALREQYNSLRKGSHDYSIFSGTPERLEGILNFLKTKGEGVLSERYTDALLKEAERWGEEDHCRICFLGENVSKIIPVVEAADEKTVINKAKRFLAMIAKTKGGTTSKEEGNDEVAAALVTNAVLASVNKQWTRVPKQQQQDFIESSLRELSPALNEGRDYSKLNWKRPSHYGHLPHVEKSEIKEAGPAIVSELIEKLPKSDEKYKIDKLREWAKVFTHTPISTEAFDFLMESDDIDSREKEMLVNEMWDRGDMYVEGDVHPFSEIFDYRLNLLLIAAKHGVSISQRDEKIGEITSAITERSSRHHPAMNEVRSKALANIEEWTLKIQSATGERKNELGSGFKTERAKNVHGYRIYFDGELVGVFEGAQFSSQPSNKEIIAWVKRELIDYDRVVKGSQWRDNVYVWKKGWDTPKVVFEDHAYEYERSFHVKPPIVMKDGKIEITINSGGETRRETISLKDSR